MLKKKSKFTIIEILVVVAIITILAAMVYPSYLKHTEKAKIVTARGQMTQIITALESYKSTYVDYELINSATSDYTVSWTDLKTTLTPDGSSTSIARNPRQIKFLTEDLTSPWLSGSDYAGHDYRIKLDINEDGNITLTEGDKNGETVQRDIVVYVKNANLSTTTDDIRSWD